MMERTLADVARGADPAPQGVEGFTLDELALLRRPLDYDRLTTRSVLDILPRISPELRSSTLPPTERLKHWAMDAADWLGGDRDVQQRAGNAAHGIAQMLVLPSLADTAFYALEGDPANTILAATGAIPGAGAARGGARKAASEAGRGAVGEASLASRLPEMYNPPWKPARPLGADYPNGAPRDPASGALTHDIEGRPLVAKYVAGRRTGADAGLSPAELEAVAEAALGGRPERVPASKLPGRDVGGYYDPNTGRIGIWDKMPPASRDLVAAHEIAHGIKDRAGRFRGVRLGNSIPIGSGQSTELKTIYNDLNNRQLADARARNPDVDPAEVYWGTGFTPRDRGYSAVQAPSEYMTEAIRAYLADPNYLKTVAPRVAAAIRKAVNAHPELSRIIQFNSVLATLGLADSGREER